MNHWIVIAPTLGGQFPKRCPFNGKTIQMLACGNVRAYFQRDGRFVNEQLFAGDEQGLLISDGVLLNLAELKTIYQSENLAQVIRKSWIKNKGAFYKDFIGPFSGCIYDSENDTLTAYINQTGDTMVFTYCNENCRMVSNDLNMIEAVMAANNFPRSLDETAILYLLTFGFMIDDRTVFQEIKRVFPGEAVKLLKDSCERTIYHRFSFHPQKISFQESIELVDQEFQKAVRRCQEKDREYGVDEHLMDLSGGLDSRMTSWVAHMLGYGPAVYNCISQSTSDEISFSSKVADALGGQFIYKRIDDATFIYEVDHLVNMNYGISIYCGITGGEQLLRTLNVQRFGLEHTGQVGDAIIGTLLHQTNPTKQDIQDSIRYSQQISYELPDVLLDEYENAEAFALYTRGFLCALSAHVISRNYFYAVSPFIDPDFLSLCMSIPLEYRQDHKLYWAWVDAKYPEAAKLPSTRTRPETPFEKALRLRKKKIRRKIQLLINPDAPPNHMNPTDYWYRTKPRMQEFITEYYRENRPFLERFPETAERVDRMYTSPKSMDKLLAINALAVVKRYFQN